MIGGEGGLVYKVRAVCKRDRVGRGERRVDVGELASFRELAGEKQAVSVTCDCGPLKLKSVS